MHKMLEQGNAICTNDSRRSMGIGLRVIKMSFAERNMILGTNDSCNGFIKIFENFTPQEAKAKLDEWERKQIRVGDVVYADDEPNSFGVVTWVNEKFVYIMWDDGSCGSDTEFSEIHKTGKHIDIQSVLEQIGKEE